MYEDAGDSLRRIFQTAKDCGATTSCDLALPDPQSPSGRAPWRRILEKVLPYVDIFLPSIEEAFFMLEPETFLRMKEEHGGAELIDVLKPSDYSRVADQLLEMGCKMTTLKAGHRGFYLKTGSSSSFEKMGVARPGDPQAWHQREIWHPAYRAEHLASATGSGDASIAGFLTGFLRGLPPEKTLSCATCVGWQNLQELDAVSGVKGWDYTLAMIEKGMPMLDAHLESSGWTWTEKHNVWAGPEDILSRTVQS